MIHLENIQHRTEGAQRLAIFRQNPVDGTRQSIDGFGQQGLPLLMADRDQTQRRRNYPGKPVVPVCEGGIAFFHTTMKENKRVRGGSIGFRQLIGCRRSMQRKKHGSRRLPILYLLHARLRPDGLR